MKLLFYLFINRADPTEITDLFFKAGLACLKENKVKLALFPAEVIFGILQSCTEQILGFIRNQQLGFG